MFQPYLHSCRDKLSARKHVIGFWAITFLVLAVSWYTLSKDIHGNTPYTSYIDEPTLLNSAADILRTGSFKPTFFVYPSLSIYLTAFCMIVADFMAASHGTGVDFFHIPAFLFPYYQAPELSQFPKLVFAFLGVVATWFAGRAMAHAYQNRHLTWLVPLIVFFSALYLRNSTYLNPNVLACFFTFACLAAVIRTPWRPDYVQTALIPGIMVGFTAACKYNFGVIILAPITAILLYPQADRGRKLCLFLVTFAASYLLAAPYSLLDLTNFLGGTAFQLMHYQQGHPGHDKDVPGWPQAWHYLLSLNTEYGIVIMLLTLAGVIYGLRTNLRATLVLSISPLTLFAYMSDQKATFTHNLLPTYVWVAMYASLGLLFALSACFSLPSASGRKGATVLLALALALTLPWKTAKERLNPPPDSRNVLKVWLEENIPQGSTIELATEIGLDYQSIKSMYNIMPYVSTQGLAPLQTAIAHDHANYAILPVFTYDPRDPNLIPGFMPVPETDPNVAGKVAMLNAQYGTFTRMAEFGQRKVLMNYMSPTPKNNPMFFVTKISKDK